VEEDLWEDYSQLALTLKNTELIGEVVSKGLDRYPENHLLQLYQCIYRYSIGKDEEAFEKLVELLIQEPALIEEFVLYYPKAVESKDVQFLIQSLSQKH